MNRELAILIKENGSSIFGYLLLRAEYVLTKELGEPIEISLEFLKVLGGPDYLRSLEESGLVRLEQRGDNFIATLYEDGWLGFPKKPQKDIKTRSKPSLLTKLLEYLEKPIDWYKNGSFNLKYPALLERLRGKYSDEEILEVAKYVGKIPLNLFLSFRVFEENFAKMKKNSKKLYGDYSSWDDV